MVILPNPVFVGAGDVLTQSTDLRRTVREVQIADRAKTAVPRSLVIEPVALSLYPYLGDCLCAVPTDEAPYITALSHAQHAAHQHILRRIEGTY